jgi:hypothetical protein
MSTFFYDSAPADAAAKKRAEYTIKQGKPAANTAFVSAQSKLHPGKVKPEVKTKAKVKAEPKVKPEDEVEDKQSETEAKAVADAKVAIGNVKQSFDDWMTIAKGLSAAQSYGQRVSGESTGAKYERQRGALLKHHGLEGKGAVLGKSDRSILISCLENEEQVRAWMAAQKKDPSLRANAITIYRRYKASLKTVEPMTPEMVAETILNSARSAEDIAASVYSKFCKEEDEDGNNYPDVANEIAKVIRAKSNTKENEAFLNAIADELVSLAKTTREEMKSKSHKKAA